MNVRPNPVDVPFVGQKPMGQIKVLSATLEFSPNPFASFQSSLTLLLFDPFVFCGVNYYCCLLIKSDPVLSCFLNEGRSYVLLSV